MLGAVDKSPEIHERRGLSPIQFNAMKAFSEGIRESVDRLLDVEGLSDADIDALILSATNSYVIARYAELLFQSNLIQIQLVLSSPTEGCIQSRSSQACRVRLFIDYDTFRQSETAIQVDGYTGEDVILFHFPQDALVKMISKLEDLYSKKNKLFRTEDAFVSDLIKEIAREDPDGNILDIAVPNNPEYVSHQLMQEYHQNIEAIKAFLASQKKRKKKSTS